MSGPPAGREDRDDRAPTGSAIWPPTPDRHVVAPDGEVHTIKKGSWYISIEPTEEGHRAIAEIAGDFPGSPVSLTFGFAFRGGKIRRLTIRPVPG